MSYRRKLYLWRRLLIVGRRFLSRWMSLASSSVLARLRCILLQRHQHHVSASSQLAFVCFCSNAMQL